MNEKTKWYNPSVIFVKPRTNKESRDIIQRLHNIGKTEFYNYCHINKDIKPFYSAILLADIVPLNKLFGKDYVFCIDKISGSHLRVDNRAAGKFIKISNHFRELKNRIGDEDVLAAEILMKIYEEEVE